MDEWESYYLGCFKGDPRCRKSASRFDIASSKLAGSGEVDWGRGIDGLLVAVVFALTLFLQFDDLKKAVASRGWPHAPGTVVSSLPSYDCWDACIYFLDITYNYSVAGTTYNSDDKRTYMFQWLRDRAANSYHEDEQIVVYFDSVSPEVSALEPGVTWRHIFNLLLTVSLIVLMMVISISGVQEENDVDH